MYLPLHDRILSALGAAFIVALLGAALLIGLRSSPLRRSDPEALTTIAVPLDRPPPPQRRPPPKTQPVHKAPDKPAPVNLRNKATPIVAPKPVILVPQPPLLTVAPKPGVGLAASNGAGDRAGNGEGAGGDGDGDGGGGDESPPRLRKGSLRFSDLPQSLRMPNFSKAVGVIYTVETNGRADECEITKSSGLPELDAITCRLIEERFRFEPSRDKGGRPVAARLYETHHWEIETPPDSPRYRD